MQEYRAANKNSVFVKQTVGNICTAIAEHRWKDSLTLLPSFVAVAQEQFPPYFLWKVAHIVLVNNHVSQDDQKKIVNILSRTNLKNFYVVIDMMAEKFNTIDAETLEYLYQLAMQTFTLQQSKSALGITLRSYRALWWYLEWRRCCQLLEMPECMNKTGMKKESVMKLGHKCYNLLKNALFLCQGGSEDPVAEKLQGVKSDKIESEWILGPLLDVQERLASEGELEDARTGRSLVDAGLKMVESGARKGDERHLPAWRIFYIYLAKYHSRETATIEEVLTKIVSLAPGSSLVLDYVNHFVLHKGRKTKAVKKMAGNSSCLFADKDVDSLLKCASLLCQFLEHDMWRKEGKAWDLLFSILQVFHHSWLRCWSCSDCTRGREEFVKLSSALELWPQLFWSTRAIQHLMSDPKVAVQSAYAAFIFGQDETVVQNFIAALSEEGFSTEKEMLMSLLKEKGDHYQDFCIFLGSLRKQSKTVPPHNTHSILEELKVLPSKRLEVKFEASVKYADDSIFNDTTDLTRIKDRRPATDLTSLKRKITPKTSRLSKRRKIESSVDGDCTAEETTNLSGSPSEEASLCLATAREREVKRSEKTVPLKLTIYDESNEVDFMESLPSSRLYNTPDCKSSQNMNGDTIEPPSTGTLKNSVLRRKSLPANTTTDDTNNCTFQTALPNQHKKVVFGRNSKHVNTICEGGSSRNMNDCTFETTSPIQPKKPTVFGRKSTLMNTTTNNMNDKAPSPVQPKTATVFGRKSTLRNTTTTTATNNNNKIPSPIQPKKAAAFGRQSRLMNTTTDNMNNKTPPIQPKKATVFGRKSLPVNTTADTNDCSIVTSSAIEPKKIAFGRKSEGMYSGAQTPPNAGSKKVTFGKKSLPSNASTREPPAKVKFGRKSFPSNHSDNRNFNSGHVHNKFRR